MRQNNHPEEREEDGRVGQGESAWTEDLRSTQGWSAKHYSMI